MSLIAVTNLLDIEEDMISPTYGIKGKVDASVEIVLETSTQASALTAH